MEIPKDFLKKLGPAADRLELSNICYCCSDGDIKQLSLSKSTARRHRAAVRSEQAAHIKRDFICNVGQINFDGKLLADLGGFGKVNRLAVVLVQEEENKILAICKTSDSTGRTEAEKVQEILHDWNLTEKIVAVGFDTTSSNTGVHKGACTILQQLLNRQILWMACRQDYEIQLGRAEPAGHRAS